ncbi:MAG: hypothetical protein ACLQMS_02600, partial [Desulfomonilaceae bacterium]
KVAIYFGLDLEGEMLPKWYFASVGFMAVLIGLMLTPAHAWEFNLTGTFAWTHEWYNQQGTKGFFGNYNVDAANQGTANLNFWDGQQFDTNFVTGANAASSYFQIDFDPVFKINPGVRWYGHYRIASWGDPVNSRYITESAPGIRAAISEGQWTQFWVTANMPWGVLGVGKRPWKFGTALQYDGSDSLTTESISLTVPYGPFDIGIAYYPFRFAGRSGILGNTTPLNTPAYSDPYDLPGYVDPDDITNKPSGQYYSRADRSGSFSNDFLVYLNYSNGPVSAGVLGAYGSYHIGPEANLRGPVSLLPLIVPLDADLFHGTVYEKYNNGRFFLNSELAWLYWTDRFGADPRNGNGPMPVPPPIGAPQFPYGPPQTRYIEQLRAAIETGLICGPAKLSFLSVWTPGPDRRNGAYIDRQPAAFVRHPNYDARLGNYSLVIPYAYLFTYNYGSGLNAYNLNKDGYLRDAFVLAGRLDYAVASNLNLFGTFFWAQRTSVGYEWGCLRPQIDDDTHLATGNIDFSRVTPGSYMSQNPNTPNITDRSLGYEIDLGFNWKLLEAWQFGMTASYWAPGNWFGYACIDRSDPNWNQNNFATGGTHNRSIDAVIGGQFNITSSF